VELFVGEKSAYKKNKMLLLAELDTDGKLQVLEVYI
jgi:hypothetical protein